MILLTLSRGKGKETVRLQLPASPAEIGEAFASLDRISRDTTATAILDVSGNVPVLYRCLYDVDVEDSEQFQKLQKLAERTEALSPTKAAIFSGALDAEHIWNLDGSLTVADRLDEYMLVNNVSSDSELGIYLVNKGITPFPDRFKPYINYARVGAEYRESMEEHIPAAIMCRKRHLNFWRRRHLTAFFGYGWKTPALCVYRAKRRRSLCLRPLSNWRVPDSFWEWTASIWRNSFERRPCGPIWGNIFLCRGWI